MRKRLLASFITLSFVLGSLLAPHASALSGGEFQAGRIIDDSVFFNNGSMLAGDIQQFFNAKVPVCDTWGNQMHSSGQTRAQYAASRGVSTPFTCLKDYHLSVPSRSAESGLCGSINATGASAAEAVAIVSQSCGINPQVLIVLLQKEQSLITDDWPWPVQYQKATGYGCPDTAPCDEQYYGLFNQLYSAARQFKKYARDAHLYNHRASFNNSIRFHPNAACGSSTVYIENQATANLYNYTPYRPNQAALNNLYGTGDGCSAYGNRNFWRFFHDWFGNTYSCETPTVPASTLGTYNPAGFFYQRYCHSPGHATRTVQFGNANWIPLSGDWNSDGVFTPGAYDPATGRFYLRNTNDGGPADMDFQYGNIGWIPLAGDWNGNGYWSIGLYDPATSIFYLKDFNGGGGADYVAGFGNAGWKPIAGDWNSNSSTTIGVYNPNTAIYYLDDEHNGLAADRVFQYGNAGWTPLAGDWDGNGYWSVGSYEPSGATFYLRNMNNGGSADITTQYGNAGWTPVVGDWDGRR